MPKLRNVYIVPGYGESMVARMFTNRGWGIVDDIDEADLVQFIGGEDVTPSYYGQHIHTTTQNNPARDAREHGVFDLALAMDIPVAGICRGGQFLNVMNGGSLYQDVNNHASKSTHKARIIGKLIDLEVSSTHHQMMRTNTSIEADCHVLMIADIATEKTYMSSLIDNGTKYAIKERPTSLWREDIEAVYYGSTNSLCFQPHPEFVGEVYKDCTDCYFNFINQYLFGDDRTEPSSSVMVVDNCDCEQVAA